MATKWDIEKFNSKNVHSPYDTCPAGHRVGEINYAAASGLAPCGNCQIRDCEYCNNYHAHLKQY